MHPFPPGEFQQTIGSPVRQIYGRVAIDYSDPFKDEGVTALATESLDPAFLPQITDGKDVPAAKWASLDGSWELDGTWALAPAEPTMQVGWWSAALSDAVDSSFASPPILSLVFSAPQVIDRLTVTGDSLREEYPADFTVRLRGAGNTMLLERTITGNTEMAWEEDVDPAPVPGVAVMELEISRWSHPGRQAKIVEFYTALQEVYEGDNLISIQLLEEREVSGGSLPIGNISANEIEVKLNNLDRRFSAGNVDSPLYGMLRANRRIRAWLGVDTMVEYRDESEAAMALMIAVMGGDAAREVVEALGVMEAEAAGKGTDGPGSEREPKPGNGGKDPSLAPEIAPAPAPETRLTLETALKIISEFQESEKGGERLLWPANLVQRVIRT